MTQPNEQILVIVPAYNEAAVIRKTVRGLLDAGYPVVVVDDCSTDGTAEKISDLNLFYIRHAINLGQGAALMTGMAFARRRDMDYVVHFDADGQHQVEDIPGLLAPLLEGVADITLGSRFLRRESRRLVPPLRRVLLKIAVLINGLFANMWLTDAHNGLRALNHRALEKIQLRENGMAHATEILSEIRQKKLRYREVPMKARYTEYSRSKGQSALDSLSILTDLIIRKIFL
ncbi:MAG: glycosyltransferase family 2 protein [Bacteroidia bacterium]|nr:glycosyltransferase family 2 protein [Bacteroidia bacterium]